MSSNGHNCQEYVFWIFVFLLLAKNWTQKIEFPRSNRQITTISFITLVQRLKDNFLGNMNSISLTI